MTRNGYHPEDRGIPFATWLARVAAEEAAAYYLAANEAAAKADAEKQSAIAEQMKQKRRVA